MLKIREVIKTDNKSRPYIGRDRTLSPFGNGLVNIGRAVAYKTYEAAMKGGKS